MKSDLSKVKVGDTIWTILNGYTEVIKVCHDNTYCIETDRFSYTIDGKLTGNEKHPSAFLENPFKNKERVVEVSNDNVNWKKRVFIKIVEGDCICWYGAETLKESENSVEVVGWNYMRELPNITKQGIIYKLGMSQEEIINILKG